MHMHDYRVAHLLAVYKTATNHIAAMKHVQTIQ